MGIKKSFKQFLIGNWNKKQRSKPNQGKNSQNSIWKKFGTGIHLHACRVGVPPLDKKKIKKN